MDSVFFVPEEESRILGVRMYIYDPAKDATYAVGLLVLWETLIPVFAVNAIDWYFPA